MVPSGAPTEETMQAVSRLDAGPGDIIIDGGNTRFHDDMRRAAELGEEGHPLYRRREPAAAYGDLTVGYCLMVGGEQEPVNRLAPYFRRWRLNRAGLTSADHGAGHYVKMVHNGIEYSMMQGYAEGFELMSKSEYQLDLAQIADVWMHGSVVRSWLLELAGGALQGRSETVTPKRVCAGFRRGTMDGAGRHRERCAGSDFDDRPLHTISFSSGGIVRRKNVRGVAECIRRTQRPALTTSHPWQELTYDSLDNSR